MVIRTLEAAPFLHEGIAGPITECDRAFAYHWDYGNTTNFRVPTLCPSTIKPYWNRPGDERWL